MNGDPPAIPAEPARAEFQRLVAAGEHQRALGMSRLLLDRHRSVAMAQHVLAGLEPLRSSGLLNPCKVSVLRSCTVEPVLPLFTALAAAHGLALELQVGPFNAYAQELLNPRSALYRFQPDIVILMVDARDVAPDLWHRYAALTATEVERAAAQVVAGFGDWVRTLRANTTAHLVLHNLAVPARPALGILDDQDADGQQACFLRINRELQRLAAGHPGVHLVGLDALMARHGKQDWCDEAKWLAMRLPVAARHHFLLAQEWLRFLLPLTGRTCKVLVTDLDNTLWGGVVGEDGVAGLKVGTDYPGAAFLAVQRAMLDLRQRGILLAICSKNNPADVAEALETHPDMLLRPHHFAAERINWGDKPGNLRSIAQELNLGLDALAFFDDHPAEREFVRQSVPEVTVLELPADPTRFAQVLQDSPVFERLTLTPEDHARGDYYAAQRLCIAAREKASSLEDFYRSLQMRVQVVPVTPASLPRLAQLTQKTNQFNLTTHRYSEPQLQQQSQSAGWHVFGIKAQDRFGDNGLVGMVALRREAGVCEIDTFLLSCRVIGRTIETAVLAHVWDLARRQGDQQLVGWYRPTAKNQLVEDFYARHGFQDGGQTPDGHRWLLNLAAAPIEAPDWILLEPQSH